MKISVVIAAYRGEKFIGEQLASLAGQTVVPDEIIITDDSPDKLTKEAVVPFLSDPRIRYYHNDVQLGVNRNFEKALRLAGGDIIFFCDQDDVWSPYKIEKMVAALKSAPRCLGAFCNSCVVDAELVESGISLWEMRGFSRKKREKFTNGSQIDVFLKKVFCSTHNIAIRRELLDLVLPFPEIDPFYTDTFLGILIASLGKWVIVDEELTLYRVHGNNLSSPQQTNLVKQASDARKSRQKNIHHRIVDLSYDFRRRLKGRISERD